MIHHLKTTILRIRLAMAESDLHWIETIGRQQRAEHRARLRTRQISPKLREKPRPLGRRGIAHRAKRGQTPVDLTLMFLCEYNRQYENRTANQVAPG